jgi:hypothetical protein
MIVHVALPGADPGEDAGDATDEVNCAANIRSCHSASAEGGLLDLQFHIQCAAVMIQESEVETA